MIYLETVKVSTRNRYSVRVMLAKAFSLGFILGVLLAGVISCTVAK